MTSPRRKTGPSRAAPQRPLEILLIEDTPTEAKRTMRALRRGRVRPRVTVVEGGEEALALLRSRPAFRPDVILLDWYLPRKGGREVLADLKSDPRFRHVPIVVLSISDRQEDVTAAYEGRANAFVTKPADPGHLARALRLIEIFWTRRLPNASEAPAGVPRKRKTKPR
jgi:CheY-like chemotaxis protein